MKIILLAAVLATATTPNRPSKQPYNIRAFRQLACLHYRQSIEVVLRRKPEIDAIEDAEERAKKQTEFDRWREVAERTALEICKS